MISRTFSGRHGVITLSASEDLITIEQKSNKTASHWQIQFELDDIPRLIELLKSTYRDALRQTPLEGTLVRRL